ncbi:MAG: TolC family protein [Desulforhopalus sp.]|nr:TolC family protein [Desulforhopalus sp.]
MKQMICSIKSAAWSLLLVGLNVFPASATAISLDEVVELALEADARLQAETFAAEARTADGWQAVAGYGPVVSAYGSYMRSRDSTYPEKSSGLQDNVANFYEKDLYIELEQPVIDLEKVSVALRGVAEMEMAEIEKKKAFEGLWLRIHERYYDVLSSRQNQELAKRESAALLHQLETTKEKLELGFGTITDQHNAEARYHLSLAAEVARKTELDNARTALEEIIHQQLNEEIEDLPADTTLPDLASNLASWHEIARLNNSDLGLRQLELKMARFTLRAAKSRFLPSLVLFANYTENDPDGGLAGYGEESRESAIGLKVKGTLLSGGRDTAATVAASRRAKEAKEQVKVADRAVNRSVDSLWESIINTRNLIAAYRLAVDANRLAMESTQVSYDEGAKVLLDVLNAQQDYFRSLREYKTTRYDYMILLEKFKQVVGVEEVIENNSVEKNLHQTKKG